MVVWGLAARPATSHSASGIRPNSDRARREGRLTASYRASAARSAASPADLVLTAAGEGWCPLVTSDEC